MNIGGAQQENDEEEEDGGWMSIYCEEVTLAPLLGAGAAVGRLAHQTHTALILSQHIIGGITRRYASIPFSLLRGPDKFRTEHKSEN